MKITKKSLNFCSGIGAALLLGSWLFQNLYADAVNAERATLARIQSEVVSHETLIPVFKALVSLSAGNKKVQKEIESLATENLFMAMSRFKNKINLPDLLGGLETEGEWIPNPSTIEEKKRNLKHWYSLLMPYLQKWQDPEYIRNIINLPESDIQKELDEMKIYIGSLIADAVPIKIYLLDTMTRRNRWIFITIYILGSMLAVGAQMLRVVFFTKE